MRAAGIRTILVGYHARPQCLAPMSTSFEPPSPALALALLLVVGLGFTAAWCLLAVNLHAQVAWMAPLAAVDALFMMQLGRMPPRW